jgi:hypothetical protein
MPVYTARFQRTATVLLKTQGPSLLLQQSAGGIPHGEIVSARSLGADYAFAISPSGWDWLQQVRLDASGYLAGVFNSAPITTTVQTDGHCDEESCEGCADVTTQRFCLA